MTLTDATIQSFKSHSLWHETFGWCQVSLLIICTYAKLQNISYESIHSHLISRHTILNISTTKKIGNIIFRGCIAFSKHFSMLSQLFCKIYQKCTIAFVFFNLSKQLLFITPYCKVYEYPNKVYDPTSSAQLFRQVLLGKVYLPHSMARKGSQDKPTSICASERSFFRVLENPQRCK